MTAILRALRNFFRLRWTSKPPGSSIPCDRCKGTGMYDYLYQYPVRSGEETVRTIDCLDCTGLGYHFSLG